MKALELFNGVMLSEELFEKFKNVPENASQKIDHLANMLKLVEKEIKILKSQEKEIASKRKIFESLIDKAEITLKEEMSSEGMVELQGEMIKYCLSDSAPSLVIDDESLIPNEYKERVVSIILRTDAIKDELKLGTVIPGAHLRYGKTLKLTVNKG